MASKVLETFIKMALFKKGGAIASDKAVQFSTNALEKRLINLGIDPRTINNQTELKQILAYVKQLEDQQFNQLYSTVLSGDDAANFLNKAFPKKGEVFDLQGNKLNPKKPIVGGTQGIEDLLKTGDITKGTVTKQSDKVKNREMFKGANERFSKTDDDLPPPGSRGGKDDIAAPFQSSDESLKNMIEAENKAAAERIRNRKMVKDAIDNMSPTFVKGDRKYNAQMVAEDLADKRFNKEFYDLDQKQQMDLYDEALNALSIDIEDFAQGGRAGLYTGGMVDVEPSLSDIGHGSDALMARTRLVAPNSQATTSTGLNYLLAEDNDNIRVPFSAGGGGRRAFLKLLAALTGGAAAFKSGILGLSEGAGKKAVTETVKKAAGSAEVPPYFFKLVDKIKTLGDETLASQDKAMAKKYKDYVMEEDFAGNVTIIKKNMDDPYPEEVIMSYKVDDVSLPSGKGMAKVDEYEEFTVTPDGDGKMKDIQGGVPDEVVQEGTMFEDNMTEFGKIKKADGGRIGFSAGKNLAAYLADKTIKGSSTRFLEKVFGKQGLKEIVENDPDMHRGLLEVVEMFRAKDSQGLKTYMQKFLPHMDDEMVEDFIIGGTEATEGIAGQLTRLGSGRDYKGKLEMMKKLEEAEKLNKLDIDKMKPNAKGGLQTLLGE